MQFGVAQCSQQLMHVVRLHDPSTIAVQRQFITFDMVPGDRLAGQPSAMKFRNRAIMAALILAFVAISWFLTARSQLFSFPA